MSTGKELSARLGRNIRMLREARSLTQSQIAKLAGIPRATLAHLESGEGNPTLAILSAVADAFQVSLEELVTEQRATLEVVPKSRVPVRMRGNVEVRKLLPDPIPGMELIASRFPRARRWSAFPTRPERASFSRASAARSFSSRRASA